MKKFILIYFLTHFIMGISQEKKITFSQELTYLVKNKSEESRPFTLKVYASDKNEFLTKINLKEFPFNYYFTDALGTSTVSFEMNNRLTGSSFPFSRYGYGNYSDPPEPLVLDSKKLNTQETILGTPCSHYLIYEKSDKSDNNPLQVCIDDRKTSVNNVSILTGILGQFMKTRIKNSGMKGLILKAGPKETYDKEYIVLSSKKDSESFVYFDHVKAMTEYQRKQDSIMLAYKNLETADDDDTVAIDSATADDDMYDFTIPTYISEYKKGPQEDGNLAIRSISSEAIWKGLPQHCKNFEKSIPEFTNKELKSHVKNYVGQMCDMYLTQAGYHTVAIKTTLDEIRREVLYFNNIKEKLDQSDQKKLNNYLNNLD
ncbi:hypothetical protein [Chryseobacterium sp. CT-SW4]|uniref:hypothetical protein n=1 Tax=Chryseobacterium sp. SW-1 TaxID=3157343 RepID=UPI003B013D05